MWHLCSSHGVYRGSILRLLCFLFSGEKTLVDGGASGGGGHAGLRPTGGSPLTWDLPSAGSAAPGAPCWGCPGFSPRVPSALPSSARAPPSFPQDYALRELQPAWRVALGHRRPEDWRLSAPRAARAVLPGAGGSPCRWESGRKWPSKGGQRVWWTDL